MINIENIISENGIINIRNRDGFDGIGCSYGKFGILKLLNDYICKLSFGNIIKLHGKIHVNGQIYVLASDGILMFQNG